MWCNGAFAARSEENNLSPPAWLSFTCGCGLSGFTDTHTHTPLHTPAAHEACSVFTEPGESYKHVTQTALGNHLHDFWVLFSVCTRLGLDMVVNYLGMNQLLFMLQLLRLFVEPFYCELLEYLFTLIKVDG